MQKSSKSSAQDLEKSSKTILISLNFVVFTHVHKMRDSNKNSSKIKAKTIPNPLKFDADFDANFCVDKKYDTLSNLDTNMCPSGPLQVLKIDKNKKSSKCKK